MPHLKAGHSEATGVVHWGHHGDQVGAVGGVLVVELHGDFVITWRRRRGCDCRAREHLSTVSVRPRGPTGLLGHVGDATRAVLVVVERDLRPAGSLHGDGQAAGPRLSGPDTELGWRRRDVSVCVY